MMNSWTAVPERHVQGFEMWLTDPSFIRNIMMIGIPKDTQGGISKN